MKKLREWLAQDEVLKLICGYFIIGAFAGILIALFGMIWLGIDCSNYVFPKLLATSIITMWISRVGWDCL